MGRMGNFYSTDPIPEDQIHINITCNIEAPQQKYRIGTVINRLRVGGVLNMLYWTQTSPSASVIVQPNQTVTIIITHSTVQIKHLTSIFTYFPVFIQKLKKEAKWSAIKVATLPAYHNYAQENCEESQQKNRLPRNGQ